MNEQEQELIVTETSQNVIAEEQSSQPAVNQTIIINQQPQERIVRIEVEKQPSNKMGTSGMVLSILAVVFCWLPVVNIILFILGFVFSFIGVFKAPRGKAIAGLILCSVLLFIGTIALSTLIENLPAPEF